MWKKLFAKKEEKILEDLKKKNPKLYKAQKSRMKKEGVKTVKELDDKMAKQIKEKNK